VKETSIRAVWAEPHIISDDPQTNAASGPPIFQRSQSSSANAASDGSTNGQME
jgi:hypothetical protein